MFPIIEISDLVMTTASDVIPGRVVKLSKLSRMTSQVVLGSLFLILVPGYQTVTTNNLRLWCAKPARQFDVEKFKSKSRDRKGFRAQLDTEPISRMLSSNDDSVDQGIPPKSASRHRTPIETAISVVLCISLRYCASLQEITASIF